MDFGLSQEQELFVGSLARLLAQCAPLDRARAFAAGREERAAELDAALAEHGVCGVLVPEAHGGAGLTLLDAALVSEQLGAAVAPAAYIGSCVLAPLALMRGGSAAQQARWLPQLAASRAVAGVAISELSGAREDAGVVATNGRLTGRALFVLDFAADLYVVADKAWRLHLVEADAPGLKRRRLETIDATRPTGELMLTDTPAELLAGSTNPAIGRALLDAGRVILAADTLGAAQAMIDKAVAYSKERVQFDRPIASFQAVKHMCAEMAAALEPCRALVWFAAHAFDALPEEASLAACHAKAHLSEVGTRVGRTATEVHGGMGFTDLVGLHFWFKRIGFNRQLLGGPQAVRADAARLRGLVA